MIYENEMCNILYLLKHFLLGFWHSQRKPKK